MSEKSREVDPLSLSVRTALIEHKRKITEIAPKIGTTYDVLSNMLNGRTKPDPILVERIRVELKKPKGWPYDESGELRSLSGTPLKPIPIRGSASAGAANDSIDESDPLLVPSHWTGQGHSGLVVEGISMYPHLEPGDTAVFKDYKQPRPGLIFLTRDRDLQPRIKQLIVKSGRFVMHSFNPAFHDEAFEEGSAIEGFLVGLYRIKGSKEYMVFDPTGIRFEEED